MRAVAADHEEAERSITQVRIVRSLRGYTLLDVTIKTGRTHQIRVHLASAGHPIVGDDKYGDFDLNKQLARGEVLPARVSTACSCMRGAWPSTIRPAASASCSRRRCRPNASDC